MLAGSVEPLTELHDSILRVKALDRAELTLDLSSASTGGGKPVAQPMRRVIARVAVVRKKNGAVLGYFCSPFG